MVVFLLVACAEPPPLMAGLAGRWEATFTVYADGEERAGTFDLGWDDEEQVPTGEITMEDVDRQRVYGVLGGEDIEDLGVALQLIELAGVRQLFVEVQAPDSDELIGGWRTRWGCAEAGGQCGEDGGLVIRR